MKGKAQPIEPFQNISNIERHRQLIYEESVCSLSESAGITKQCSPQKVSESSCVSEKDLTSRSRCIHQRACASTINPAAEGCLDIHWLGDIFESISNSSSEECAETHSWWECDFCGRAFADFDIATLHEQQCNEKSKCAGSMQKSDLTLSESCTCSNQLKAHEILTNQVCDKFEETGVVEVSTPLVQLFSRAQVMNALSPSSALCSDGGEEVKRTNENIFGVSTMGKDLHPPASLMEIANSSGHIAEKTRLNERDKAHSEKIQMIHQEQHYPHSKDDRQDDQCILLTATVGFVRHDTGDFHQVLAPNSPEAENCLAENIVRNVDAQACKQSNCSFSRSSEIEKIPEMIQTLDQVEKYSRQLELEIQTHKFMLSHVQHQLSDFEQDLDCQDLEMLVCEKEIKRIQMNHSCENQTDEQSRISRSDPVNPRGSSSNSAREGSAYLAVIERIGQLSALVDALEIKYDCCLQTAKENSAEVDRLSLQMKECIYHTQEKEQLIKDQKAAIAVLNGSFEDHKSKLKENEDKLRWDIQFQRCSFLKIIAGFQEQSNIVSELSELTKSRDKEIESLKATVKKLELHGAYLEEELRIKYQLLSQLKDSISKKPEIVMDQVSSPEHSSLLYPASADAHAFQDSPGAPPTGPPSASCSSSFQDTSGAVGPSKFPMAARAALAAVKDSSPLFQDSKFSPACCIAKSSRLSPSAARPRGGETLAEDGASLAPQEAWKTLNSCEQIHRSQSQSRAGVSSEQTKTLDSISFVAFGPGRPAARQAGPASEQAFFEGLVEVGGYESQAGVGQSLARHWAEPGAAPGQDAHARGV